jgi:L-cystine transport system ATP-binding protein
VLTLEGVSKSFGDFTALHPVDLTLNSGETTVLLGPSGSGKSTLLRCIDLLEVPETGRLTIDDLSVDLSRTPSTKLVRQVRARSVMVFQSYNLFPHLTALENVTLSPVRVGGTPAAQAEVQGRELLDRVGLSDKADSYPAQLSGGQQQRVAIARALAVDPDYLLFDEPTSALDPELAAEVIRVMDSLAEEHRSLLVVTHNMHFARKAADRILFLEAGRIRFDGPPEDFFSSEDARIRQFLTILEMS